jgi:hypothetical protein
MKSLNFKDKDRILVIPSQKQVTYTGGGGDNKQAGPGLL